MQPTAIELSKCIVTRNHIGYDEYINICTNHWVATVNWTGMDWFFFCFIFGLIGGTLLFVIILVILGVFN